MKIRPLRAKLFYAGGSGRQTDMMKLKVAFHNFTNVPKNRRDISNSREYVVICSYIMLQSFEYNKHIPVFVKAGCVYHFNIIKSAAWFTCKGYVHNLYVEIMLWIIVIKARMHILVILCIDSYTSYWTLMHFAFQCKGNHLWLPYTEFHVLKQYGNFKWSRLVSL